MPLKVIKHMDTSFYNPVSLSMLPAGTWFEHLQECITDSKSILFMYSKSALQASDPDEKILPSILNNPNVLPLTNILSNPSIEQLAEIRQTLPSLPKTIIALGGGSVIDMAKILIALGSFQPTASAESILQIIDQKLYLHQKNNADFKLIAIPTTAGTGSELTRWATIWDMINKQKYSVERDDLYPSEAWIDPALTVGLSPLLTVSTGLDALSHAVEAYWSTKTNPIVRRLSAQAITQIVHSLKKAIDSPKDLEAREGMCLGSVFAGLAFSQTRTTACHALSYPLTARFGIPHGIAVVMSLIPIMRLNWESIQEKELFLTAFSVDSLEEIDILITSLVSSTVCMKLRDYGISKKEIQELMLISDFPVARMGNNPIPITRDIIYDIYLNSI